MGSFPLIIQMADFESIKNKYNNLIIKRNFDKNKLVELLQSIPLSNELLFIIAGFVYPEKDYDLYIVFQHIHIITTPLTITKKYLFFSGSIAKLEQSIQTLKDVNSDFPCYWTWVVYNSNVLYDQRCEQIRNSRNWSRIAIDNYEIICL
jgi:hypothetical protein